MKRIQTFVNTCLRRVLKDEDEDEDEEEDEDEDEYEDEGEVDDGDDDDHDALSRTNQPKALCDFCSLCRMDAQ